MPFTKINSKLIRDLSVKGKAIKLPENDIENLGKASSMKEKK